MTEASHLNGTERVREEALALAMAVRSGSLNPLLGALRIRPLLHQLNLWEDSRFIRLLGICDDIEPLPVEPSDRANWDAEALRRKDIEAKRVEEWWTQDILAICNALVSELQPGRA